MKPTKVNFNLLKNHFNNLVITSRDGLIFYDDGEFPDLHPTYGLFPVLVTEFDNRTLAEFKDNFVPVREEVDQNILIIQNNNELALYLNEILEFYLSIDSRIIEDDDGSLSCHSFNLKKTRKKIYYDKDHLTYQQFLKELKVAIRNEYQNIMEKHDKLISKHENKTSEKFNLSDLRWTKNINDLVELVKALKLTGSINNSTNSLTLDEAYRFFGDLFSIEIKRPEDQLRQKAETMKKLFFLEELNDAFQKDMKELMKRRMQ